MTGKPQRLQLGLVLAALLLFLAACRQDMQNQPVYKPYRESDFFANKSGDRPIPAGTVARGFLREDVALYQGKDAAGEFVAQIPMPVDRAFLERGRERYQIYCSICHDSVGTGRGMIVRRGFQQPESFHSERLRETPVGYYFDVMSNGFGVMSSHAHQVNVEDRWAIAAYMRVLQTSQSQRYAELSAEHQQDFQEGLAAAAQRAAGHHGEGGHGSGHGEAGHGGGHGSNDHGADAH